MQLADKEDHIQKLSQEMEFFKKQAEFNYKRISSGTNGASSEVDLL